MGDRAEYKKCIEQLTELCHVIPERLKNENCIENILKFMLYNDFIEKEYSIRFYDYLHDAA
ncbi:hypothetical protein NL492_26900, partial [Klebsiella pneumoniae]|nr:hypothetical protein [Klebsiella pneumoniae]